MSNELEILKDARVLIARGWCQGASARDTAGDRVEFDSPEACSWCSLGALYCATPSDAQQRYLMAGARLMSLTRGSIAKWNDDPARTKDEVLAMFDEAITGAEAATDGQD